MATPELRDPWGALVAGVAAGSAWAVGLPVAAAIAVGGAVFAVKAVCELGWPTVGRRRRPPPMRIRYGSPEQRWLERSAAAVRSFQALAGSARPGPLVDYATNVGSEAAATLEAVRRLGQQVSAVSVALDHVDGAQLAAEERRLVTQLVSAGQPEVREELGRSLQSVRDQIAVHQRLDQAHRSLLARMEAGALGLEGLVARLAEILALRETALSPAEGTNQIDVLVDDLESLRSGLAETEDLSRQALMAYRNAS
jgi:hypothetical protein